MSTNKWRTSTLPPVGKGKSRVSRAAAAREMMSSTWAGTPRTATATGAERSLSPVLGSLSIEEENNWLREELARLKNEVVGCMNRRSMAMVAGGGFKSGPTRRGSKEICECDQLREKLSRCQHALEQAREKERRQAVIAEASAEALAAAHEQVQFHAARAEACASYKPEMRSTGLQTDVVPSKSMASQATSVVRRSCEVGVQAEPTPSSTSAVGSQTFATPRADAAAQYELDVRTVEVQAMVDSQTHAAQTEDFSAEVAELAVQTETTSVGVMETQTEEIEPQQAEPCKTTKQFVEIEVQTTPLEEPAKASASKGVQAVPRPPPAPIHRSQQTEPSEDEGLVEKLRLKVNASETVIEVLGLENVDLKAAERALQDELRASQQQVATWQKAAQSKVFGHLNVLVVSPKAECTVRGESLDMASWDISRIQSLIEEEVIPRFTRVFTYEGEEQPPEVKNAIDGAMKEFASTFRAKLSEMLTNAGPKAPRS